MLIKLENNRYINSDHIIGIFHGETIQEPNIVGFPRVVTNTPIQQQHSAIVILRDNILMIITSNEAAYIAASLDSSETYTTESPADLSLESRIAIFLSNQTTGLTEREIADGLDIPLNHTLQTALFNLKHESVITQEFDLTEQTIHYYHASNTVKDTTF